MFKIGSILKYVEADVFWHLTNFKHYEIISKFYLGTFWKLVKYVRMA